MLKWLTRAGPVTRAERLLVALLVGLPLVVAPEACRVEALRLVNAIFVS